MVQVGDKATSLSGNEQYEVTKIYSEGSLVATRICAVKPETTIPKDQMKNQFTFTRSEWNQMQAGKKKSKFSIRGFYSTLKEWLVKFTKRPFELLDKVQVRVENLLERYGLMKFIRRGKQFLRSFVGNPRRALMLVLGLTTLANLDKLVNLFGKMLDRLMRLAKAVLPESVYNILESVVNKVLGFVMPLLAPVVGAVNKTTQFVKDTIKNIVNKIF